MIGSGGAAIVVDAASEPRPNVGRGWVWGAQQAVHCGATVPSPADGSVGGLVSPPSGDMPTSSPSRGAPDEVGGVPSRR